jgi:hypothetical protein
MVFYWWKPRLGCSVFLRERLACEELINVVGD